MMIGRNWNPHILLVGIQNSAFALEDISAVSQRVKRSYYIKEYDSKPCQNPSVILQV